MHGGTEVIVTVDSIDTKSYDVRGLCCCLECGIFKPYRLLREADRCSTGTAVIQAVGIYGAGGLGWHQTAKGR